VFEGPARIARSFEDALGLQPGEVLVATHLDPGWTVLFSRAGALVMEVGGVVSHAAVIARELGIPAVAGLTGATRSFTNGQRLRVDGRTGIVEAAEQQTDSG
jgi:pyruvate,water dikinase